MPLEAGALSKACGAVGATGEIEVHSQLCRAQLGNFQQAILGKQPILVACTQEAPLFSEIAGEDNPEAQIAFTNIRERAGWSDNAAAATPKIAALLTEAALEMEPTPAITLESKGVCLVYGRDERAIEAAKQLADRLEITVLLSAPGEIIPPGVMNVPIFQGTIADAKGHLGAFGITVTGYAAATPSSRGALSFEAPQNSAFSECDLIFDMSGREPLFPAHEKRDGYVYVDANDPVTVQKAIFDLADMVGEYDKPRYIRYDGDLCAHSRSRKTGCTRCLDVCPTSAITSAGDVVEIDPFVCAGCGNCASVCPTGAATYQMPAGDGVLQRLRTLLGSYRRAGGEDPILLMHDTRHGDEMIGLIARAGPGLPANVIPFALNEVTQIGLDALAAALAYGASQICILVGPDKAGELTSVAEQIGLAETIMEGLGYGGGRVHVIDETDPDAVAARLAGLEARSPLPAGDFLPIGGKRERTMLALHQLHDRAPIPLDILPLPGGAPFGSVAVKADGCTMCLACVGACPTGAIRDDQDRPWLGFNEDACVQCGLCRNTCPESVITLEPRLNFSEASRGTVTLNEEEPFNCIRCGKPFGVRSTIERISEQLAGKHYMFASGTQADRIRMCDDCRVIAQFEAPDDPLKGKPRPAPRTTDDDLREREIEEARAKLLAERAKGEDGQPN